jgi:hypothetical protein
MELVRSAKARGLWTKFYLILSNTVKGPQHPWTCTFLILDTLWYFNSFTYICVELTSTASENASGSGFFMSSKSGQNYTLRYVVVFPFFR